MAQTKRASGGARMVAAGKKPMLLGWGPEYADLIERAANAQGLRMTEFVMAAALAAARDVLEAKSRKSPKKT